MERVGAAVIGGGAVGCAVARELAQAGFSDVFLLERHAAVGEEQSGRNSGVIHAGIYYAPGSLKAAMCVAANRLVYEFCAAHGVAAANTGKLVVACDDREVADLHWLLERAEANGVPGVRLLSRAETAAREPNVHVPAALLVPTTGIVDAAGYVNRLAALATEAGAALLTDFEVTNVEPHRGAFEVTGRRGGREETFAADVLVNAAGLECDTIGRMIDPKLALEVVPLRGEYCTLNRRRRPPLGMNGMNVYPVPEWLDVGGELASTVGVHLTPTFAMARDGSLAVGDTVTVGPEFSVAPTRSDLTTGRKGPEHFLARARRFFPGVELADLEPDFAGIMVQLKGTSDFIVRRDARHDGCVHLLGIGSPGLTCSLALAGHVRELLA